MFGFYSKNQKTQDLLRQSRQDFGFDSDNVKERIMMSVKINHLSHDDVTRLTFNPHAWPRYAIGAGLAIIFIASTSGLAFASTQSKPGELLFSIQKLQNQIVLSLPIPASTKANISTNIAAKRLKELDETQKNSHSSSKDIAAEVEETQASMQKAFSLISAQENKDNDNFFTKLDLLSAQHQQTLKNLSDQTVDSKLKSEIERSAKDVSETQNKFRQNRVRKPQSLKPDSVDKKKDSETQGKNSGSTKLQLKLQADD